MMAQISWVEQQLPGGYQPGMYRPAGILVMRNFGQKAIFYQVPNYADRMGW
ncbi:hypothetical protein D3C85_1556360 [compost metagenome]